MQEVTGLINKNEIIKQITLFSDLDWFKLRIVLPRLSFFEYKQNEVIYREGDPPDAFYLLLSGRLQLSTKSFSGEEKVLEYLTRNRYFGIISLLTGEPHSVTTKAVSDSLILKINKKDFDDILKRIPQLAVSMSKSLSRRIRKDRLHPKEIFETKIISVLSSTAKSGKNAYVSNLALSLKKETHKKVILLGLNLKESPISEHFDLLPKRVLLDFRDVSINEEDIKKGIISYSYQIDLLQVSCPPAAFVQKKGTANLAYLLGILMKDYHYIVINVPSGSGQIGYEIAKYSDLIQVITNGDLKNLKSTREFIKQLKEFLKKSGDNLSLIVNEAESGKSEFTSHKMKDTLGHNIYAILPFSKGLEAKEKYSTAVLDYPDCSYSLAIRNISRQIGGVLVGLALGAGSALGLAHIGVLKMLEKENITVDIISASSIGAVIGALWASGISASDLEKIAFSFKNKFKSFRIFDFTFPKLGLTSGKNIVKFLNRYLKGKTFDDLKIPFKVVACDLENTEAVVFEEGSLIKAVRASIAIPGVLNPLFDQGRFLMDGGVVQPLPLEPLIRLGVSKIIAVNTLPNHLDIKKGYQKYQEEKEKKLQLMKKSNFFRKFFYKAKQRVRRIFFPNIFDVIVIAIQASESSLAEAISNQADIYIHPDLSGISWFEFYKAEELIKRGEEEALRVLPQIREALQQPKEL